jgi:hypothetical protein
MLAVEPNLIVRYLTGDHPGQSAKARAVIDGEDVFVSTTVLLEPFANKVPSGLMTRRQAGTKCSPAIASSGKSASSITTKS